MRTVGQLEKETQKRIMRLFIDDLGYDELRGLREATDNTNVDEGLLEHFLFAYQEYDEDLARRAIAQFVKVAENTSLTAESACSDRDGVIV